MALRATLFAGLLVLPVHTGPAAADALDGDWCNPVDGKLTIDGSTIITPAGKQVRGLYGRHRFEYTAPDGDWKAGERIVILQFNERLMELQVGDTPPRAWRPCQIIS